jgi:hypothetical protein
VIDSVYWANINNTRELIARLDHFPIFSRQMVKQLRALKVGPVIIRESKRAHAGAREGSGSANLETCNFRQDGS